MADSVSIDTSELNTLAADLTHAGSGIAGKVRPVVHRGANNIKRQLRDEMAASEHFKGVASSIDYGFTGGVGGRMVFGVGVIEAEIGPRSDAGSPGNLANIAYFGNSNGGGGTVPDPVKALDAEVPKFTKALEDIVAGLL